MITSKASSEIGSEDTKPDEKLKTELLKLRFQLSDWNFSLILNVIKFKMPRIESLNIDIIVGIADYEYKNYQNEYLFILS